MKNVYYKIDCNLSQQLNLSGNDRDVFFFIRSFKDGCTMNQCYMAELLCMSRRTLQNAIASLVSRGLVTVDNLGHTFQGGRILTYTTNDTADATPLRKNDADPCEIPAHPLRKNDADPCKIPAHPLRKSCAGSIYKDNYTTTNTTTLHNNDESHAREEEFKKNGTVADVATLAEELRQEISNGGSVAESAMRLYGLYPEELIQYVGWFVDKLNIDGTTYKSRGDFKRHFQAWLRIQVEKKINTNNNGKQQGPSDDYIRRVAADIAANGGLAF